LAAIQEGFPLAVAARLAAIYEGLLVATAARMAAIQKALASVSHSYTAEGTG